MKTKDKNFVAIEHNQTFGGSWEVLTTHNKKQWSSAFGGENKKDAEVILKAFLKIGYKKIKF